MTAPCEHVVFFFSKIHTYDTPRSHSAIALSPVRVCVISRVYPATWQLLGILYIYRE